MSDTPLTDAATGFFDLDTAVDAEFARKLERQLTSLRLNEPFNRGLCDEFEDLLPPHPHAAQGSTGLWLERLKTMRELLKKAAISLDYFAMRETLPEAKNEGLAIRNELYDALRAPAEWKTQPPKRS